MGEHRKLACSRRHRNLGGGLVALSVTCALALISGGQGVEASSPGDYPMLGYDATHAAVSPDTTVSASNWATLTLKHKVLLGGFIFSSPAVAYNSTKLTDVAYVGTAGGSPSTFNAVDATTGTVLWSYPVTGPGVYSSPAVDGNTVYFGTQDGYITALDATTGNLVCRYNTGGRVEASPVVKDVDGSGPLVFVGDTGLSESHNAGHEWALNGVGNTPGTECTVRWMFNSWVNNNKGHGTGSWSSPALANDATGRPLLVFGSSQPDDSVYALDARTGTKVWSFQTFVASDSDVGAAPTISAPRANGLADGAVYVMAKDRIEYAIDLLTGTQIWAFSFRTVNCSTDPVSGTALSGGNVYVNFCKWVYALHAAPTGPGTTSVVWRSPATAGKARSSPTISGGANDQVILRGDKSGNEDAFRLSTGASLPPFNVGSTTTEIISSTAVSNGMVFFAGTDGNLYILG